MFRRAKDIRPLDFRQMGTAVYDITRFQDTLFVADSMTQVEEVLPHFFAAYDDAAYHRILTQR